MAESFLINKIEKLILKLGSTVVEAWNVRDDVEKLVDNMSEIKTIILDAEEQQDGTNNNHPVQPWLEKLKDCLDDFDDLLDDFSTEDLRHQVMMMMSKHKNAKKVGIFFSSSNQVVFSFKMAKKLKELRKRVEGLNGDRRVFAFNNRTLEQRVGNGKEVDQNHSFIRKEEVIGREEDMEELKKLLMNTDINVKENVSVISIIGIGGLGKTALAQLVYNDREVQAHFELKNWVCVADDSNARGFDVKSIAAKIAETNDDEMERLQKSFRDKIEGMMYLIVLDDIWNEDRERWLELIKLLKDGAKGSKIIITTRSEKVARVSGASSLLFLRGLDETQSWKLFSQLAFQDGEEPENQNLVSIGKEIAKKCSGVPLAIRSIGNLMYTTDTDDWSHFLNKDLLKIDEEIGNKVFQLIKLSYDHLPFHLKKCFAFCSLFPKDYPIEKEKLIRLWIAHGFVESSDESTSLEDTGDKYFKTLVHRSFFQDLFKEHMGNIYSFKMHDLIVDLARFVSRNNCVIVNEKGHHIGKQTRHVSFGFALDSSWQVPSSLLKAYNLRTFLLPLHTNAHFRSVEASLGESACNSIMTNFKRFRVLTLNHITTGKISSCIGMLNHLRYLDLSQSKQIEVLPQSITNLIHLETLLLNDCSMLKELPKDLWKLINLRHLELDRNDRLSFMPGGIGRLTNLQTLTHFVLDATFKEKHSARANELRQLNLKQRLEIRGLECLRRNPAEAKDMNLIGKPCLQQLELLWEGNTDDNVEMEKDDKILQGLAVHPNTKALSVTGFGGMGFSSSGNSFTNLDRLYLNSCTRLQHLPKLPNKSLILVRLPCIKWIVPNDTISNGSSSSIFSPPLKEVLLYELPNLQGWCTCAQEEVARDCYHHLKSLDTITIWDCPNLISIPEDTNSRRVNLSKVKEKILQQVVNHSKVEILEMQLQRVDGLKSLSGLLQQLDTLRDLHIGHCEEFDPCNDEEGSGSYSMQWKQLKNLKHLSFKNIPKMECLPEGLQHVTTLQTLRIASCANLTCLPEWVTSLQSLYIRDCPKLTSIPKRVDVKRD